MEEGSFWFITRRVGYRSRIEFLHLLIGLGAAPTKSAHLSAMATTGAAVDTTSISGNTDPSLTRCPHV